ncbi:MAG TPA: aldolase/citrate lyase family protein [Kofleriaceae bacterium]|nr:aldolase/citrate lyase family protein [Kofleriaceae bacterium]
MSTLVLPGDALFGGERPFPVIPSCEHFAGSEKLIGKAFQLQDSLGPIFDITMDLEDGAPAGREQQHAEMVVDLQKSAANVHKQAGIRIHDYSHPLWRQDVDIVVAGAGETTAYITIPKPTSADQVREMIAYIQKVARDHGIVRTIPIHVLIETHGALREADAIAALPWMQVLDFGLMDFISGHHGAVPASAMRSPGQFDHKLVGRAKTRVVAAALANGVVPAHNVTLDLKNVYQTHDDARRANQEFGFLRMWSIYPAQIKPIVDAMAPDFSEVTAGCEILLAAQQASWGPIQHAGELHDRATYRYFWELLQRAHVSGQPLPADVRPWLS